MTSGVANGWNSDIHLRLCRVYMFRKFVPPIVLALEEIGETSALYFLSVAVAYHTSLFSMFIV